MVEVTFPDVLVRAAKLPTSKMSGDGATLKEVFKNICVKHERLHSYLFYENDEVKEHFLLVSNGALISPGQELLTSAKVDIMLATSGGMDDVRTDGLTAGLTHREVGRYVRHLTLPGVGRAGQARLKNARVLIIGTGGLGSPISLYLAAAGVGVIGLVDSDVVEMSNLHRQIVHGTSTIGMSKVQSAQVRLLDLNPDIQVKAYAERLDVDNALDLVRQYDLVVDGTDNFTCRYTVNDACTILGKPLIYGAVYRFDGQISVFNYNDGPCYRCLFPQRPPAELSPNCNAGGVIGVLPGIVGLIQAIEAIKVIIGLGDVLSGRLLSLDALGMHFEEIKFSKRSDCPDCGVKRDVMYPAMEAMSCATMATPVRVVPADIMISAVELSRNLEDYFVLDVRDPGELEVCALPGAVNIPLGDLDSHLDAIDVNRPKCIVCYSGARATTAARMLLDAGIGDIRVLDGGMKRWVREVEPTMPIY